MKMLVWELIGAAVGAGFASGREIAVFFAQHGKWSYAALAASGATLLLAAEPIPAGWKNYFPEKVWNSLLSLLLIATGGAMLAGAGEISSQVMPFSLSRWIGMAATLFIAWILALKMKAGLACVSWGLAAAMLLMLLSAFRIQPMKGAVIVKTEWSMAMLSGLSYGGFNAALQWPVISASTIEDKVKKRATGVASAAMLLMLWLGQALLKRNAGLMGEAMPFLALMKEFGNVGYAGFIICLYLAVLSTLTACIRSINGHLPLMAGIVLVSVGGFGEAVNRLYPILGGACCIMLIIAKITNSLASSFLSKKEML